MVPVANTAGWYLAELFKYPPRFKIGFLSNNPPVYDAAPFKELLEQSIKNGIGRLQ
jgi:arylsulfatase